MSNFTAWWGLVMLPDNDGLADDTSVIDDGAGLTRWGWTYPTWCDARRFAGLPAHDGLFRAMTAAQAGTLAQVYHWNRLGGRRIIPGCDVSLIDWAWTSGGAVHEVQHHLGCTPDGIVGPETIAAINALGFGFAEKCCTWRQLYYDMLGFGPVYPGLYRRARDVLTLARKLQGQP